MIHQLHTFDFIAVALKPPVPLLCDIPSSCCFFTGPWTVTRSSLHMLRWIAAFCRPVRPVLLLVLLPRSQSPVVGVLGLCWMWHGVPFAHQPPPPPPRQMRILGNCEPLAEITLEQCAHDF